MAAATITAAWVVIALIPPTPRAQHPYFAGLEDRLHVIAHRGGAEVAPESTIPTYLAADTAGVDILEMDVRPTADGVLVVFHDRRVHRITGGTGKVEELTLAQLQAMDAGYRWSRDGGLTYPYRGKGFRIPTFAELLEAVPGRRLLIELKTDDDHMARQLCSELRADGRRSLAIVASFSDGAMATFREACPEVATSAATFEGLFDLALRGLRLDGLYEPDFDAYHAPVRFGPLEPVHEGLIERARERGLPVQVWTVNREEEMERMIDLGVDGIMTDRPDVLLEVLRARGLR
jgi:glycerophosphoryl diester phosphodiesterase